MEQQGVETGMAGNSGGPWGGGGGSGGGGNRGNDDDNRGGRRPGEGQQIPEIDEIVRKGQEQLRVLMGGRGGGSGGSGGGEGPQFGRGTVVIGLVAAAALWAYASVYTVAPEERSVELFLGERFAVRDPGLNFAPWPLVRAEIVEVTTNRTESIGIARSGGGDTGLMLTTDENIVDIDFEVVWNISNPEDYLFNLAEPEATVRAVSEAAMREIIAASQLAPILNRDRQIIADPVQQLIQQTLNSYESGINVVRLNLDRADPPVEVIDAFRDVQAAEQERDRLERQADAYANQVLAGARGEAAQLLEESEGYRARVVNEAEGEASRFAAVLEEYLQAPDVTRTRLYLETMERVLGGMETIILDTDASGGMGGVVPYLPLNELRNRGN
jgi:membrane protease subunit HflK